MALQFVPEGNFHAAYRDKFCEDTNTAKTLKQIVRTSTANPNPSVCFLVGNAERTLRQPPTNAIGSTTARPRTAVAQK